MAADEASTPERVLHRLTHRMVRWSWLLLVLASVEPFLSFYDRNRLEYVQTDILMKLGIGALLAVTLVFVALLFALPRVDPLRIACVLAVFVFCFFRYNMINQDPSRSVLFTVGAWALVTALAVATVTLWSRHPGFRLFLILYLVVSAVLPGVSVATGGLPEKTTREPRIEGEPIAVADEIERTPDVWWLVLDSYGREDMLERFHDFKNEPFLTALEQRDFRVSDDSYTSYPVTPLSISSVLQMEHHRADDTFRRDLNSITVPLSGGGRVVEALREHGYRYLYADNDVYDWAECDPDLANMCVPGARSGFSVGHLTRTVSELTPLVELMPSTARIDIEWRVEQTLGMMDPDKAEFAFIHTMSPHDPYWFDGNCELLSRALPGEFNASRYPHEISCLNDRVLNVVDSITQADPEAIVIVQGDHGPGGAELVRTPYENWTDEQLLDRYAILEAMLFPEACSTPEGVHSNVSTFEYVLACIEGRQPVPLPERYFFWRWNSPNSLSEIDRPDPEKAN